MGPIFDVHKVRDEDSSTYDDSSGCLSAVVETFIICCSFLTHMFSLIKVIQIPVLKVIISSYPWVLC